ncbi:MAG: copper resistance protein NlpE [Alcaligenaceae bacterium]|nr:copper resistance protein NlpE [Alcaligenaceae bacterium]
MKKFAFALIGVAAALSTACAQATKETQEMSVREAVTAETTPGQSIGDPTPQVVDWDGRWSGVIPCDNCPGIEVDLTFNNDGSYRLREAKLESLEAPSLSEGTVSWEESTRILTLTSSSNDTKQLLFAEGGAVYLDEQGNPLPDYQLNKQAEYRAHAQQLILPLQSIRVEDNQVFFKGLLNFKERQNGGFQSVKGEAVIDCAKKHVTFRDASYYPQVDAIGERIVNISQMVRGGWSLGDSAEESVFVQVAETFCPQM